MDVLKEWALCLIAAAAVGTLATVIVPRGSMDKTVRAVVGIFVVAVVCSPLAEIKKSDFALDVFANSESVSFDNTYTEELNLRITDICRETVEKQIKEIAAENNITVSSIETDISVDAENCIIIHEINVYIDEEKSLFADSLSEKISEKLGVPVDVNAE